MSPARLFSPYAANPFNVNPLRDVVEAEIDFGNVRGCHDIKLFLSATNVETGQLRVFETGEVRRRLLYTIEQARRNAAERRADVERARASFEMFLADVAVPLFRQFAIALKAQGYPFQVFTPAGVARLVSDRSSDDALEIALDTTSPRIAVVGRSTHTLGRHVVETEDVLHAGPDVEALDEEEVLRFLLERIVPFVER